MRRDETGMRERFLVKYSVYAFAACVLAASLCACGGQAQGTSSAGAAASEEAAAGASADAGAGADAASSADDSSSAGGASEPASQASATKRRIIIDTDTGADDAEPPGYFPYRKQSG